MPENVARVALVDLDDTLITSSKGSRLAMKAVIDIVCGRPSSESGERLHAAWSVARSRFWMNEHNARMGRFDPQHARKITLAHALDICGLQRADVDSLIDIYSRVKESNVNIAAGAIELLAELRERGAGLALVTNGTSREQRDKLARFGLISYFDAVIIEEEIGVGKPDLYIITHAIRALNADQEDTVVIGDDLARDGRGAELAGFHFLHLHSPGPCEYCAKHLGATHVSSLAQVRDHLLSYPTTGPPS